MELPAFRSLAYWVKLLVTHSIDDDEDDDNNGGGGGSWEKAAVTMVLIPITLP